MIYLDNAATTQISEEVLDAMMPYLKEEFGNAGTIYGLGRRAASAVAEARGQVAKLIGCDPKQVVFTSGGSEANNLVFAGLRSYLIAENKKHIITSSVEHDSVLKAVRNLCIKDEFDATFLRVNERCEVSPDDLSDEITARTGLVSVMYVNNETGAVNPVKDIGEVCSRSGVLFHTDCVQANGFHRIDVDEIECDFLSISSHKIHGPKGVGALYIRDPSLITPMIHGGASQEFGLRGGTENVAGIVGFGKACEIALRDFEKNREQVSELNSVFRKHLTQMLKNNGLGGVMHINGSPDDGKVLNLRFEGIDGETLLLMLDARSIFVSAGSACRSHESKPSHVLTAMGLSPDEARDSIRVSFSAMLSSGDVMKAATDIGQCVMTLKEMLK